MCKSVTKATVDFVMSVHPSEYPRGIAQFQPHRVCEICQHILILPQQE